MNVDKITYLFIKSDYKLIKINLSDILYLSGLKDYTQIYLKGKTSPLTTLQNLKEFESKLPADDFVRVHRSYIVAMKQISYISRNDIIINGVHIPIGNSFRAGLDEVIQKHS
ncbi:MAG: LytTR family DNA-binding domain-containing protein [Flavobacterium sp.]|nr:LytTR family DNA-binding domain-containing protein [Flavobacterium sp.]